MSWDGLYFDSHSKILHIPTLEGNKHSGNRGIAIVLSFCKFTWPCSSGCRAKERAGSSCGKRWGKEEPRVAATPEEARVANSRGVLAITALRDRSEKHVYAGTEGCWPGRVGQRCFFFLPATPPRTRWSRCPRRVYLQGKMSNRYSKLCHCNRITSSPFLPATSRRARKLC